MIDLAGKVAIVAGGSVGFRDDPSEGKVARQHNPNLAVGAVGAQAMGPRPKAIVSAIHLVTGPPEETSEPAVCQTHGGKSTEGGDPSDHAPAHLDESRRRATA